MSEDDRATPIEDPPDPDLEELQQRNVPYPAVPVQVDGVASVRRVPSQKSAMNVFSTDVGRLRRVLGDDPRRARTIMVAASAFLVARSASGSGCLWPANVALYLENQDEVWATSTGASVDITVIQEYWAQ